MWNQIRRKDALTSARLQTPKPSNTKGSKLDNSLVYESFSIWFCASLDERLSISTFVEGIAERCICCGCCGCRGCCHFLSCHYDWSFVNGFFGRCASLIVVQSKDSSSNIPVCCVCEREIYRFSFSGSWVWPISSRNETRKPLHQICTKSFRPSYIRT